MFFLYYSTVKTNFVGIVENNEVCEKFVPVPETVHFIICDAFLFVLFGSKIAIQ